MSGAPNDIRTLWIGDIETWMTESHIQEVFNKVGKVISVKLIRSKETQLPAGYCFVEFSTHEEAEMVLMNYNSQPIAGVQNTFRMNWGKNSTNMGSSKPPAPNDYNSGVVLPPYQEYSVYVGDLELGITEASLADLFRQKYMSVISTKIIADPQSKLSKGYGFVKFSNMIESQRAIHEMNGYPYKGKFLKVSPAVGKQGGAAAPISAFGASEQAFGQYGYYGMGHQNQHSIQSFSSAGASAQEYYAAYAQQQQQQQQQSQYYNQYAQQYGQYSYMQSYYNQDMYAKKDGASAAQAGYYPAAQYPATATTAAQQTAAQQYYAQANPAAAAQYAAAYQQQADYYAANPAAYAQYSLQYQQQYPSVQISSTSTDQLRSLQMLSEAQKSAAAAALTVHQQQLAAIQSSVQASSNNGQQSESSSPTLLKKEKAPIAFLQTLPS